MNLTYLPLIYPYNTMPTDKDTSAIYAEELANHAKQLDSAFDSSVLYRKISSLCTERMTQAHQAGSTRMSKFNTEFTFDLKSSRFSLELSGRTRSDTSTSQSKSPDFACSTNTPFFKTYKGSSESLKKLNVKSSFGFLVLKAAFHILGSDRFCEKIASELCKALAREEAAWHHAHGVALPSGALAAHERSELDASTGGAKNSHKQSSRI